MINIKRTIEEFGYHPDSWKSKSAKKVIHNCDDCGKERSMRKSSVSKICFCKKCLNTGSRNPNYTDGERTKAHYCIDCEKLVSNPNNTRCRSCWYKWIKLPGNHPSCKDTCKNQNHCKKCGTPIKSISTYCRNCRSKENNNLYKDGRTLKQHYCKYPGCKNKICLTTALYGKGFCNLHSQMGKNHPRYIDGRSSLTSSIRALGEYYNWRLEVFKRDRFQCQCCNVGRSGILEAHHKKSFSKLLQGFLNTYDQFSPMEDKETLVRLAIKWEPFWDINNGETLCVQCHKLKGKIKK